MPRFAGLRLMVYIGGSSDGELGGLLGSTFGIALQGSKIRHFSSKPAMKRSEPNLAINLHTKIR